MRGTAMHTLTPHQLTTPLVERGRFGLGEAHTTGFSRTEWPRIIDENFGHGPPPPINGGGVPGIGSLPLQTLIPAAAALLAIPVAIFLLGRASQS